MLRRILLRCAPACAALVIGGCQGGHTVTFTVEQAAQAQRAAAPLAAAHIRAVALNTNDVPLPVSIENLEKLDRPIASGITDAQGRSRLSLRPDGIYLIEVNGPAFGALSDAGPWRWTLGADGRTLTPVGAAQQQVELFTGAGRP